MAFNAARIHAQIAVTDEDRARAFYEGKLGLTRQLDPVEGSWSYAGGGGTLLHLYVAPDHAGSATGTVARFDVPSAADAVEELTAAGVRFERYDEPVATDDRGIHDSGYGKIAWFDDPDGNTFAIEEVPEP